MVKAKGRILEWGNSWGIRVSKADMIAAGLSAHDEVEVEVKKKITTGRDIWGMLPKRGSTAKVLKEIDEWFDEEI